MLLGAAMPARAIDPGEEALLGLGAAVANTGYVPAKVVVAAVGLVAGGLAGVLTGGNARAAYGLWVPTATGTFLLTPAHFSGEKPVQFFGSDYADKPSRNDRENAANQVYDATYGAR